MCDLVENYAKEYAEEVAQKVAQDAAQKAVQDAADSVKKLFQNGVSYDVVRATITNLSDEELKRIYEAV